MEQQLFIYVRKQENLDSVYGFGVSYAATREAGSEGMVDGQKSPYPKRPDRR